VDLGEEKSVGFFHQMTEIVLTFRLIENIELSSYKFKDNKIENECYFHLSALKTPM
jgi:hypothetical protein